MRRRVQNRLGHDGNPGGVRHSGKLQLDDSVAYVERQFHTYLSEARRRYPDFTLVGTRVLEVGPGDTDATAVLFAAAGASEVVAIDRFRPQRDDAVNDAVCRAVFERFAADPAVDDAPEIDYETARSRVSYRHGVALETADADTFGRFDVIVSSAVLEHVYDLRESLAAMRRLHAPGGVIVHDVDLTEHGLYAKHGHHPLTHLTIPERLYRFIVQPSGAPNRVGAPGYRRHLAELDYDADVHVTRRLYRGGVDGADDVKVIRDEAIDPSLTGIRPQLQSGFAAYSDDDLNAASILIVGHARS